MRLGIDDGILLSDLDAKGFDITNCPFLEAENVLDTTDDKLFDKRVPPVASVTNESVAKNAGIKQSKLALNGVVPVVWLGTTADTAAPGDLVEHIANKNALNGYAGMSSGGKLPPGTVPVSGTGTVTSPKFSFPPEFGVLQGINSGLGLHDGDPVASWPDSSGLGHTAAQSVVGKQPIFKTNVLNGKPVLRFTSAAQSGLNLATLISGAGDTTIFVVVKRTGAELRSINGNGVQGTPYGPLPIAGATYAVSRATVVTGGDAATGFHVLTSYMRNGLYTTMYKDGTEALIGAGAFTSTGDYATIGYDAITPAFSDGDIAEIIIYTGGMDLLDEFSSPETKAVGDRAAIEKYLGTKYGIAVASGTAKDPSTVPGMLGWWKADVLLPPPPTTDVSVYWIAAPPESWFGINPVSAGAGILEPRFNRIALAPSMIPPLPASKLTSGVIEHDRLPPDTLLSAPGDGTDGHQSDYYARDGTYKPMASAVSYQPTLPDLAITVLSYGSSDSSDIANVNVTSSKAGVTLFGNTNATVADLFLEIFKQPIKLKVGYVFNVYSAKNGWNNSNIVSYEIPPNPLGGNGGQIEVPPPL